MENPFDVIEQRLINIEQVQAKILALLTQEPAPENLPELLTRKEAASLLRISLVSLNNWSKGGLLQSLTVKGRIRYRRADIVAFAHEVKNGRTKR